MGFLDIVKSIAGAIADEANRNARHLERKCGSQMNDEQHGRIDRVKDCSMRLKEWSESKDE